MLNIEFEKQRCFQDFVYFVETYCKIQTPIKGEINFCLNNLQKQYFIEFQNNHFNLIIKQRQIGATTLLCLYVVWQLLFRENQSIVFVTMNHQLSKHACDIAILIIDNLPKIFFNKTPLVSRGLFIMSNDTNSCISFLDASTLKFTPELITNNLVIFDEAFYMKNLLKIWHQYSRTYKAIILSTKNKNYNTKISYIFLSALFYMLSNKEKNNVKS